MRKTKHTCTDFEAQWKVDSTGSLKCVCGEVVHAEMKTYEPVAPKEAPGRSRPIPAPTMPETVVVQVAGVSYARDAVTPVRNTAALHDDHPAGKVDTSVAAFESTNRARGQQQCENLIRASADGLTAEQAADAMGVGQATTSARFSELRRAGIIKRYLRRATHSGRGAWAHKIVEGM